MAELDTIIRIIHMHVGVRDLFDGAQELTGVERAGKAILEALPRSVLGEIAARRQHQIAKGYDASHDDGHVDGSIARGAAAFALAASGPVTIKADRKRVGMYRGQESLAIYPSTIWPWENGFHASGPRDALIDAAAMIVAEIERLDRVCPSDANILNGVSTITGAELSPGVPPKMLVDADWLRRKVETDPDMDADVLPAQPQGVSARDPMVAAVASLAAAISLLERTPKAKKAAPSDKMFDQMLADYRKALAEARDALSLSRPLLLRDEGDKA